MEAQAEEVVVPIDRKATRAAALEKAQGALSADGVATPETLAEALTEMVAAFSPASRAPGGPRAILDKAEPADVKAFFEGTGLTRKELAAAAGVSTSVIATVQNENGDRWSLVTFEAKKGMIAEWTKAHAKEIKARQDGEAAAAAQREADEKARADARAAREAARAAKAAAPKATAKAASAKAPVSLPATKAAAKPGRPSKADRQANRKQA